MVGRAVVPVILVVIVAVIAVAADRTLFRPGPSPTPGSSGPIGIGSAQPVTAPPRTSAAPTPAASATAAPSRTPTTTCPPIPAGGKSGGFHSLTDVRVGHQPGADRVVFEFGQETGAQDDVPSFRIERTTTFTDTAGRNVTLEGAAWWRFRAEGASISDGRGGLAYKGSRDLDPTTTLVRDVKQVEDFEAVMIWGIGLARLECPTVTTLRSPLRVVLDFPNPP